MKWILFSTDYSKQSTSISALSLLENIPCSHVMGVNYKVSLTAKRVAFFFTAASWTHMSYHEVKNRHSAADLEVSSSGQTSELISAIPHCHLLTVSTSWKQMNINPPEVLTTKSFFKKLNLFLWTEMPQTSSLSFSNICNFTHWSKCRFSYLCWISCALCSGHLLTLSQRLHELWWQRDLPLCQTGKILNYLPDMTILIIVQRSTLDFF